MDRYPILADGQPVGELTARREGLYTVLDVACPFREGLWRAWAEGESGTLLIGVPEPRDGALRICRRFSQSAMAPVGRLLRGRLRPLEERERWLPLTAATFPFQSPPLRGLRGRRDLLISFSAGRRTLAIPREDDAPFPLETMFCFARLRRIRGRAYWTFAFDDAEWPIF